MDYQETLAARMPPPRADEPAGLRQDIVDELGDHLACAYHRELLRGVDPGVAWSRAWEHFGDPADVARRLWLDAMRGKIMVQKVLLATCLVVMAACVTALGLTWRWMSQDQLIKTRAAAEAAETNRRMSEALAQSQAANQELLKQMRDMSEAIRHPSTPDWNPVIFRLTEETPDGPPGAGFSLMLARLEGNRMGGGMSSASGTGDGLVTASLVQTLRPPRRIVLPPGLIGEAATGQYGAMGGMGGGELGGIGGGGVGGTFPAGLHVIYRISDSSGVADFGAVQPGDYRFRIAKIWSKGTISTEGQLNIMPGSKVQKSFVCPKTPPQRVTVRVRCVWPADLATKQLVLYAPFVYRYRKLQADTEWSLADNVRGLPPARQRRRSNQAAPMMIRFPGVQEAPAVRSVLCGPGPTLTETVNHKGLFFWSLLARGEGDSPVKNAARVGPGDGSGAGRARIGGYEEGAKLGPGDWADTLAQDLREVISAAQSPEPHELEWEPGTYGLDELIVLRPTRSPNIEPARKRFDVLVASRVNNAFYTVGVGTEKELDLFFRSGSGPGFGRPSGMIGGMGGFRQSAAPTVTLPAEYWDRVELGFEARLGQTNEWTIPLPDELLSAVREALKAKPTPRAKSDARVGSFQ
jgi:hypothetical protein